ncbi:hypothetical protein FF38_01046 [Lucilia cuprina]|uniref:Uncharacterized protein n=1 Tax=Lucilia cuprina TaxID=7375 RepID=A0A0L0BT48_LUCCU|nr:hypothetical protein FF38_01046 [Lucilia cuprina]
MDSKSLVKRNTSKSEKDQSVKIIGLIIDIILLGIKILRLFTEILNVSDDSENDKLCYKEKSRNRMKIKTAAKTTTILKSPGKQDVKQSTPKKVRFQLHESDTSTFTTRKSMDYSFIAEKTIVSSMSSSVMICTDLKYNSNLTKMDKVKINSFLSPKIKMEFYRVELLDPLPAQKCFGSTDNHL